jgi:hypothetical protein
MENAFAIRRRVLLTFEHVERATSEDERAAWLTFAVVGAGATGVEVAGSPAKIACHTLRGEFRRSDPHLAHVLLIEGGVRVLPVFSTDLSARAAATAAAGRDSAPARARDRDRRHRPCAGCLAHRGVRRDLGRRRGRLTPVRAAGHPSGPRRLRSGARRSDAAG